MSPMRWPNALWLVCTLLGSFSSNALHAEECDKPQVTPSQGPYDFRQRNQEHVRGYYSQVTGAHFTISVRTGVRGNTGTNPMFDLEYVLNRFPNHPEALMTMSKVQRKPGFTLVHASRTDYRYRTINCWLEIARNFTPDDPAVWLVSGIHFQITKKHDEALAFYQEALRLDAENPEIHYNIGLFYADMEKWAESKQHAEIAYAKGYPLPGLRDRLKRANAW